MGNKVSGIKSTAVLILGKVKDEASKIPDQMSAIFESNLAFVMEKVNEFKDANSDLQVCQQAPDDWSIAVFVGFQFFLHGP